jgi:hypothetical protein
VNIGRSQRGHFPPRIGVPAAAQRGQSASPVVKTRPHDGQYVPETVSAFGATGVPAAGTTSVPQ